MNYYKIVDIKMSLLMDEYLTSVKAAETAAEKLVMSINGDGFVSSPYGEFGGLMAVSFPGKAPHYFRLADEVNGVKYYEPSVTVTETVETEGFIRGIERQQNSRCWYEYRRISLEQAKMKMDYNRALELAHISWDGMTLPRLAHKYGLSPAWILLYDQGRMPFTSLCAKSFKGALRLCHQELFESELSEAMGLETQVNSRLSEQNLYFVRKTIGHRKAIAFLKKTNLLPTVPAGRLSELLNLNFEGMEEQSPAFFKDENIWYIGTSGTSDSSLLMPIEEEEYQKGMNHWKEKKEEPTC